MKQKFKRKGKFFVYIVECADGTYYTGFTPDLERRIQLHNSGKGAKYTRDRRPVKLIWNKVFKYFKTAFFREKQVKALARKEKESLVNNLPVRLSKRRSLWLKRKKKVARRRRKPTKK
ncbi:MAG: GIY-YIG nuclease family protein [Candidatus Omnitrophota bacterium]